MTDLLADTASPLLDRARRDAHAAAARAGVVVRTLDTFAELGAAYELYRSIWRPTAEQTALTTGILRALAKAGNYVAGAYAGDDLVGMSVGMNGRPDNRHLHSHIAGVSPAVQGRSVGLAIKLHQRAWALAAGITTIAWTFDPLVRRNAYFNLAKLGARAEGYLTDFYGPMVDAINDGDASDRLLVEWSLAEPLPDRPTDDPPALPALIVHDTAPRTVTSDAPLVVVPTPADIESLRRTAPETSRAWRSALREALTAELDAGSTVTGFDRHGNYLLARKESNA
ncbi:putative GNAT superfamily acetyltransferase [Saccharothrix tamanrassetensis]|uniref:Putative GNAT superfamily acetyltransferase n=1 Tax=Saccharothrix tamanrassetensis TaxID=1051531 RepID=A0A841CQP6_9PSEU|nr:GNAT family N-acetyltransferase [Saccharothrix tamanrassetensis]MBB5959540.1 putative GNAT superfamily acetyltransferase [Saccharothrix tamanrassetensis]